MFPPVIEDVGVSILPVKVKLVDHHRLTYLCVSSYNQKKQKFMCKQKDSWELNSPDKSLFTAPSDAPARTEGMLDVTAAKRSD